MTARSLIVRIVQETSHRGVEPEHREIRARDELHLHLLDLAARSVSVDEAVHVPLQTQQTCDSRENVGALLYLSVERIGEEIEAGIRNPDAHAHVAAVAEQDELLRLSHRECLD